MAVTGMYLELATAIAQKALSDAASPLVRDLIGLQDAQLQRLKAIDQDVKALLGQPAAAAKVYLVRARDAGSDESCRRYLHLAEEKLVDARSLLKEPTPARAAIDAELALVTGLLGERAASSAWARSAHDDQVAAVAAAVPGAVRTLNTPLGVVMEASDFWRYVRRARRAVPDTADELLRNWSSDAPAGTIDGPEMKEARGIVMSGTWGRWMGGKLTALEALRDDADEYRAAACTLDPGALVERYQLSIDLSRHRKARITWARVATGP